MIVQISPRVFMADDDKKLNPFTYMIRGKEALYHICKRYVVDNKETYVCDEIYFDYTNGHYYCSNDKCFKLLPLDDLLKDTIGTGWEGHA